MSAANARRLIICGRVQGVGFRPFIYRHALQYEVKGWVRNISGKVEVHAEGSPKSVRDFIATLVSQAPPASLPHIESDEAAQHCSYTSFKIRESHSSAEVDIHLPGDLFTCRQCVEELNDPQNRRYRYAFINCTQCGPRYTIITGLPYDREATSMSAYSMCDECAAEYQDPTNRRYHAEPIACPQCGPRLTYEQGGERIEDQDAALHAVVEALKSGLVVAVKGIGGYHLFCDAQNDKAILRLRERKRRPHKPFAVMFPLDGDDGLQHLSPFVCINKAEEDMLLSAQRPVVIVRACAPTPLAESVAPGLDQVGVMLPYSPLHHILLSDYGAPLIATSANITGEPVLTDETEARQRLSNIADAFLHHDRHIVRPADDSVYRFSEQRVRPLRLGRGVAPLELELPLAMQHPVLAVGAHMKNTVTLAWERRAVVSPHIGAMDSRRSMEVFEGAVSDLPALYQVDVQQVLCDAHPGYTTHQWARSQGLPVQAVYHHHAHASASWLEISSRADGLDKLLVFTWDGVGFGPDGSLWGGEALLGSPGNWSRVATFRPFKLPGGEKAGSEPWRSAAGLCWESDTSCTLVQSQQPLLKQFWSEGQNAPVTSAVGRLFDAAAALLDVCAEASFEAQAPMWLENIALDCKDDFVVELDDWLAGDVLVTDWSALLTMLTEESLSVKRRARRFHLALAASLVRQARWVRRQYHCDIVSFAGGVFQNSLLLEVATRWLRQEGFQVLVPAIVPLNDAAISLGQVVEFGAMTELKTYADTIDGR